MWKLDRNQAVLDAAGFGAEVDLEQPDRGLRQLWLSIDKRDKLSIRDDVQLLAVGFGDDQQQRAEPIDAYVRGSDLVVAYGEVAPAKFQPQLYWRSVQTSSFVGVELIASVQTSLLDSRPIIQVTSHWPADSVANVRFLSGERFEPARGADAGGLLLCDVECARRSLTHMVTPVDELRLGQDGSGQFVAGCTIVDESMEKGVIRRGRVRAGFVMTDAPEHAEDAAREAYREFLDAPLPLTT